MVVSVGWETELFENGPMAGVKTVGVIMGTTIGGATVGAVESMLASGVAGGGNACDVVTAGGARGAAVMIAGCIEAVVAVIGVTVPVGCCVAATG